MNTECKDSIKKVEKEIQEKLKTKLDGKTGRSLSSCVSLYPHKDKETDPPDQVVDDRASAEFSERVNSDDDSVPWPFGHTDRVVPRQTFDLAILVDRPDNLKKIYKKDSPYAKRIYEAAAQKMDEVIMNAFFATAKTDSLDTIEFNDKNVIPKTNSGLTIQKLETVREMMKKRCVDLKCNRACIAVTADDLEDICKSAESAAHKRDAERLVDDQITDFMGFKFVSYEYNKTGELPVWVPDGMRLRVWQRPKICICRRADKNNLPQVHATFIIGATRLDEDSVFQIEV